MIYLFLPFYTILLLFNAYKLGIGPTEAKLVFSNPFYNFLYLLNQKEYFVRLPNVLVTVANVYLYYKLSKKFLKRESDALLSAIIFAFLPATIGAGVIISKAPFVLLLTLLMLYLYDNRIATLLLALFALFLDRSFAILFFAFALYELYRKSWYSIYFFGLFLSSIMLFGFDVGGKPKSYFLDTFAIFSAIFSPLLFLYFFYTLYRILIKERKSIVWFVSATSFFFSLFLSFRQRIDLLDFAPFAVVGVVLMVQVFMNSLRVRIRRYKKRLLIYFSVVIGTLILNDAILVFNDTLLQVLPFKKHFAYRFYEGKLLAQALKQEDIMCVDAQGSLQKQLHFYKIDHCKNYRLSTLAQKGAKRIEIKYQSKPLVTYYVSKSDTSFKDVTKLHNEGFLDYGKKF